MKTLSWSSLLAVGLALATVHARAGMMQNSGGNWSQQSGSSGGSPPGSLERGYQMSGQPTMSAQFAQPGHSLVHSQTGPVPTVLSGNGDAHHGGHFVQGGDFGHGHFGRHRHPIVVFVNGAAWWYPVYTDYPYDSDVSPPVVSSSAYYTTDEGYVPAPVSDMTDAGPVPTAPDFSDLGASWGQDLRREVATWNQFVAYLKAYVITAPPSAQADFREAFIYAYRLNGAAAYDKAAAQAAYTPSQPSGPKVITFPPPPPPPPSY